MINPNSLLESLSYAGVVVEMGCIATHRKITMDVDELFKNSGVSSG